MVLYGYYKQGQGLFTNTSGTTFTSLDSRGECNEEMLINNGFTKLLSYKLVIASYEFPVGSYFAQQPDNAAVYRYVDVPNPAKFISADYVTNATYFSEIQYLPAYLI